MHIFDARHKPISLDLPLYTEAARQFKPSVPDNQDANERNHHE